MPCHVTSSVTMSAARVVSKLYFWYPVTQNWPKCWYTNSSNSLWQKLNTPNLITDLHTYHNILILNCMSHLFCGTAPCVCLCVCACVCVNQVFSHFDWVWILLITRYEFNTITNLIPCVSFIKCMARAHVRGYLWNSPQVNLVCWGFFGYDWHFLNWSDFETSKFWHFIL